MYNSKNSEDDRLKFELAYEESLSLLRKLLAGPKNSAPIGFFASAVDVDNYKRLFTRDTIWIGMAALLSGEDDLIEGFRSSLSLLINTQREDGAIPSNVSPEGKISYGVINPRVDPSTLFIIGCVQYFLFSKDQKAFEEFYPAVEKAMKYLEKTWENRKCELLYIPRAGNWADEYLQEGFVLYDEVLWFMALRKYAYMLEVVGHKSSSKYYDKAGRVKNLVRNKFWVKNSVTRKDRVFESMRKKINFDLMGYLMHFYYVQERDAENCFKESNGIFDAFGNSLAILTGIASRKQTQKIVKFIDEISRPEHPLVPAHYPFFKEETFRSKKLHQYRFKEFIGHYHNGGLWSWYTGIYVSSLIKIGDTERARRFTEGIMRANGAKKEGRKFYEYHAAKRSVAQMKVAHESGLDMYFSRKLAEFVSSNKPNVQMKKGPNKIQIMDPLSVRNFCLKKGDKVRITAVGPDAGEVLSEIADFEDKNGERYFERVKLLSVRGTPDGAPEMGVSAAAYIIAYKALTERKVLFFDTMEGDEQKNER